METLTLNDGTILENSHIIQSDNSLFIYISNGFDIKQVFDLMYDPEKTKKIVFSSFGSLAGTYKGYKKLIAVRDEGNGLITAVLGKG